MRGGFHLKKEKLTIVTIKIISYKKNCANDLCGSVIPILTFTVTHSIYFKAMTVASMTVRGRSSRTLSGTSYVKLTVPRTDYLAA